jgi:hypothetical protein
MRSLFHARWLLALVLGLGSAVGAHATHNRGGDISYTSVASTTPGVPRYHVVVRLFLSSQNPVLSQEVQLLASQGGCGVASTRSFSTTIAKQQSTAGLWQSCGSGSLLPSPYNVALYATDLDLPAGQWTLSFTGENRMADLVNVANSVSTTIYFSTFLDNRLTTQDTSPQFESVLMPSFTNTTTPPYSFSAFDADGDSLRYELVAPQQIPGGIINGGACSAPVTGYQAQPHFTLSGGTGALAPVAGTNPQGYYAMAARVSEYRRLGGEWQLIGYVVRDLTYLSAASTNQAPAFTSLSLNGGATQPLSQRIVARPGQTVRLVLTAADADAGQQLRFASEAPAVVPGLSLATLSGTQVQLTWQVPITLPPGRYAVPVAVLDDGCPYNASEERTLVFVVTTQTLAARPATNAESQAYPVPFREQVQFQAAPGQAVTLLDALGRVVARLTADASGRVLWQPSAGLPSGLYLARSANGQALARLLRE